MVKDKNMLLKVRKFLHSEGLLNALHRLERETGEYFDKEYVGELVLDGKIEKAIKYIEGFIIPPSNVSAPPSTFNNTTEQCTLKIFHDLHLQRYLEAIFHHENYEAFKILQADMNYMLKSSNFSHYCNLVDLLSMPQLPENVLKNFVSSRDPIHWKTYAEDYFIPHLYKLFENHSSLSKRIVQIDDSDSEMIIDPPTTLSRKDSVIIDLLDDERTKRKRGKDIVNLSNELPLNSSDVIEKYHTIELPGEQATIAKLSLGHILPLIAVIDITGKITLWRYDVFNFSNIFEVHEGFNRSNLRPPHTSKIVHSICFNNSDKIICSSSGGAGSLYHTTRRSSRIPLNEPNDISYLLFSKESQELIYGTQDGHVGIIDEEKKYTSFRVSNVAIIYIEVIRNIFTIVGINGFVQIRVRKGNSLTEIHSFSLPHWRSVREPHYTIFMEFGRFKIGKDDKELLFLAYGEGLMLLDLLTDKLVLPDITRPPQGSYFVQAALSANRKCVFTITSDNYLIIFATNPGSTNQFTLVEGISLVIIPERASDIVAHPKIPNIVFIGTEAGRFVLLSLNLPESLME